MLKRHVKCLGFDLGTTNSCVSTMINGVPTVLPMLDGSRTVPSVVGYLPLEARTSPLVGAEAERQALTNVKNTINASKRLIGRRFTDAEVGRAAKHVSYDIVQGPNGEAMIDIPNLQKAVSPIEVGSEVLKYIKSQVERKPGLDIGHKPHAVITCPAYFNNDQRRATELAGKLANLDVIRVLSEPTAAALLYNYNSTSNKIKENEIFVVIDAGGGTYDISIMECSGDGVYSVIATAGDGFLGGDDWDNGFAEYLIGDIAETFANAEKGHSFGRGALDTKSLKASIMSEIRADPVMMYTLKLAAETAKKQFSEKISTEIILPSFYNGKSYKKVVTRDQFELLTAPLVARLIPPCKQALTDADLTPRDISKILYVGGTTRSLALQKKVSEFFKQKGLTTMNPDESVSLGAAVQGAILNHEVNSILLLDVAPLSLGLETLGGIFSPIIKRNATIPTKKTQTFTTSEDNQKSVKIKVFQGEREIAAQNHYLGEFELDNLPPGPRGSLKIDISFEVDENGLIHVKAVDQDTGIQQSIKINNASLSQDAIDEMLKAAAENKEADKREREIFEYSKELNGLIAGLKEALQEHRGLLSKDLVDKGDRLVAQGSSFLADADDSSRRRLIDLLELKKCRDRVHRLMLDMGRSLEGRTTSV